MNRRFDRSEEEGGEDGTSWEESEDWINVSEYRTV